MCFNEVHTFMFLLENRRTEYRLCLTFTFGISKIKSLCFLVHMKAPGAVILFQAALSRH
jgi:hypothetical protein